MSESKRMVKVCPQVTQAYQHINYHEYYNKENRGLGLEKIEEDIEYLKAEVGRLDVKIKREEDTAGIHENNFSDILMLFEERIKEVEDNINLKDTIEIMRKEKLHNRYRMETERPGFINLHLRDEVKTGEVLKRDIERIKVGRGNNI